MASATQAGSPNDAPAVAPPARVVAEPVAQPAGELSRRRRVSIVLGLLAIATIVVGFLGADRWFYEHVSRVLNHEDQPLRRDFYQMTKPLWLTLRSCFGYLYGPAALCAVAVLLWPRDWRRCTAALAAVVVAALVANVAQGAIGRLRPNCAENQVAFAPPLSKLLVKDHVCFPSGEAATAFALAWVLMQFCPRWRAALFTLATLTAIARLVNGAHYPSDVAAGALAGVLLAAGVWWLFARAGWTTPANDALRPDALRPDA